MMRKVVIRAKPVEKVKGFRTQSPLCDTVLCLTKPKPRSFGCLRYKRVGLGLGISVRDGVTGYGYGYG